MTTPLGSRRAHLLSAMLITPLDRMVEVPLYGKIAGALSAIVALAYGDILAGILGLLVASSGIDYFLGRACAKRTILPNGKSAYDPLLAQTGALTKLSAIAMLFLIRGFEFWAQRQHIPGIGATQGGISAALATGLFVMDLESIEHHRVFLKARPIPGFSQLTALLRQVEQWLLRTPVPASKPPLP